MLQVLHATSDSTQVQIKSAERALGEGELQS